MPAATGQAIFTVSGTIQDQNGSPLSDVNIKLFDNDLRLQQVLGTGKTNHKGFYEIKFSEREAANPEYDAPDVIVRVYGNNEELLGQSPIRYNISEVTVIDVKLLRRSSGMKSEFDSLVEQIKPILEPHQVELGKLEENEKFQDISFLAGETRQPDKYISFLNTAFQYSVKTHIAADIFYGLFRTGMPIDPNQILYYNSETIRKHLKEAISENIISEKWSLKIEDVLGLFSKQAVNRILKDDNEEAARLKKMFDGILSEEQIGIYANTYYATEDRPEDVWKRLKEQPSFSDAKVIDRTKELLRLTILTGGQSELSNALLKATESDPELKSPEGFAKLTKNEWRRQIKSASISKFPEWAKGENEEEKTDHMAEVMEDLHKKIFPTRFFAERLKADNQSGFTRKEELYKFFNNNPEYKLDSNQIKSELEAANFDDISNRDEVEKELKTLNRLYKISDDYNHVNALYKNNISSSTELVNKYGKEAFVKEFKEVSGSEEKAVIFYRKAQSINNKRIALLTSYKMNHDIPIYAISRSSGAPEGYHKMFGDSEHCDCEHCQSVYSPSAYFTDILSFLKKENSIAYGELLRRRPDLDNILLSCKNANTVVPYLDLVNELLEKEVVRYSGIADSEGITAINHSYQTEGEAADVIAMPEHRSVNAYGPLKQINSNSIFYPELPLDIENKEIRSYCAKLGMTRSQILTSFYQPDVAEPVAEEQVAIEYFGLTTADLNLISNSSTVQVTLPPNVKGLLERMGISYPRLLEIIDSYFLNPMANGNRSITIKKDPAFGPETTVCCDTSKLKLDGADDLWLSKVTRFKHLAEKTGCSLRELERVFTAIGIADIPTTNADLVQQVVMPLMYTIKTKGYLKLPVRKLVSFYNDISTVSYNEPSKIKDDNTGDLYKEVFRGKIIGGGNSPFNDDASLLSGNLADHKAAVCAALNITESEFDLLTMPGAAFDLDHLSRLYRVVLLAKGLNIEVSELVTLLNISGKNDGGQKWQPKQVWDIIDEWFLLKTSKIKPSQYKTIIKGNADAELKIPIDQLLVSKVKQYGEELKIIKADTTIADEATRVEQYNVKFHEFLTEIAGTSAATVIKNEKLSRQEDIALANIFNGYTEEDNRENLMKLSGEVMIEQIASFEQMLRGYLLLKFSPAILKKLGLEKRNGWLYDNRILTGIEILWDINLNPDDPNVYTAFKKLYAYSRINQFKTAQNKSWTELFDIAAGNANNSKADWFNRCSEIFDIPDVELEMLLGDKYDVNSKGLLKMNYPQDGVNPHKVVFILNCAKTVKLIGCNKIQLESLLKAEVTSADTDNIKQLLKSKYSNEEWLKLVTPIHDNLREECRSSLVAWLISNAGKWNKADEIYESLLIDTQMDSCMQTSRLKQAICSVQLFVDRCLMNLEEDETNVPIVLGKDFSEQWNEWRKLYRVWEVNRKIFLYPENWIEPGLRDNKSPFFKELEAEINQNEITEERAKDALLNYLQKLDTVANLEPAGTFKDPVTGIVHVFGRTRNLPQQYYHRRLEEQVWSAWQKVDADVEGDHTVPVVWNGRLMLLWGLFEEKELESDGFAVPQSGDVIAEPIKYPEMKLAWSEYKNGSWGAKKVSKDKISFFPFGSLHLQKELLSLSSKIEDGRLIIRPLFPLRTDIDTSFIYNSWGSFVFDSCNSAPKYVEQGNLVILDRIKDVTKENSFVKELKGKDRLSLFESGVYKNGLTAAKNELPVFDNTPGEFRILPDHHAIEEEKPNPFFYSNVRQNFFVTVKEEFRRPVDLSDIRGLSGILPIRTRSLPIGNGLSNGNSDGNRSGRTIARRNGIPPIRLGLAEVMGERATEVEIPGRRYVGKKFVFHNFYQPYVCSYIKTVNTTGIDALYRKAVQNEVAKEVFDSINYKPTAVVEGPYPKEEVDFSTGGSYSLYNWELFYHIPMLVASKFTQDKKFSEARKWFHYIFNPTVSEDSDTTAARYWITKPFKKEIAGVMTSLEDKLNNPVYATELNAELYQWERNPFNPHAVARLRVTAYMRNTIIKYIDNLIEWGDELFRRDTIESINEATLQYMLAMNILGKRPEIIKNRAKVNPLSFEELSTNLSSFSNAFTEAESYISPSAGDDVVSMPYFCLPKNDHLLKYWDKVEDRLFKIRNCMNIEGVFRQLSLFENALDPSLFVRATASGLDLNNILNEINQPLPHYRFLVMLQQANELCNDVKVLGGQLLSALEKRDAEQIALLYSDHQLKMLDLIKEVKRKGRDEVNENLNNVNKLKDVAEARREYFSTREFINVSEAVYFASIPAGMIFQNMQMGSQALAAISYSAPQVTIGPFSSGTTYGGENLGDALSLAAASFGQQANLFNTIGVMANTYGNYRRRMDDWNFNAKSAELEIKQIEKQIIAAEIRLALAEKEIENHEMQISQQQEANDYLRDKFTNAELYDWMVSQISNIYFQCYQMAYTTAKRAEKCLEYELGREPLQIITPGYWDSLRKGLLSGEQLHYALRRLQNIYLEQNKRGYEIIKHISIKMLDPLALEEFRLHGKCSFEVPEVIFDIDYPGHYFRRLEQVSISIPCIAGPYTSLSAMLTQGHNRYRKNTEISNGYEEDPGVDERFVYNSGSTQAIATSHGQSDSGSFELNFRDERYLPFEGTGAISEWNLEFPSTLRQFDYNTISDVIVHFKYTARDGDKALRSVVNASITDRYNDIVQRFNERGLHVAYSLKHDFSNQWHLLKGGHETAIEISSQLLPFMASMKNPAIEEVVFMAKLKSSPASYNMMIKSGSVNMSRFNDLDCYKALVPNINLGDDVKLKFDQGADDVEELVMMIKYSIS